MINCPICRGRISETMNCLRCQTDLSQLVAIEQASLHYCQLAIGHLLVDDHQQALACVHQANQLMHTPFSHVLYRFIQTY